MRTSFIAALISAVALGDWQYIGTPSQVEAAPTMTGFNSDPLSVSYMQKFNNMNVDFSIDYWDILVKSRTVSNMKAVWNVDFESQEHFVKTIFYDKFSDAQKQAYDAKATDAEKLKEFEKSFSGDGSNMTVGLCWLTDW